jgi:hypothetical protein
MPRLPITSALEERIIMKDIDMPIEWQDGRGETTEIGYFNPHRQQCCGHCGVPGTDNRQYAYKTECTICGYVYGTNGSDMYERRCPECQGGAPGIRYWRTAES